MNDIQLREPKNAHGLNGLRIPLLIDGVMR